MNVIEYFIPDHYKEQKIAYNSVKMILKVNLWALVIVTCLIPFFIMQGFYPGATIMALSAVMAFFFLFIVYFSKKTSTIANYFAACALFVFTAMVTQTGGIHSPFLVWMLIVAPVSILSLPHKQGYFWVGMSATCFLSIVVAELFGIPFNHNISENTVVVFKLLSYSLVMVLFVYIVQSFQIGYRKVKHQLEESNRGLQDSNEQLDRFASIASHDLKSPLRSIVSFAGLIKLKYGANLPEEGKEFLKIMSDNAKQMNNLIEDILEYSKSNSYEPMKEKVSLNEIVAGVASEIGMNEQLKEAQIIGSDLPDLFADSTWMKQLFQNLICNGLKYNSSENPRVEITFQKEEKGLHFQIKDNGIGIAEEYKEKIFEMFERLHGKGTYEGTGIGLAICKKIVNQYKGDIWIDSVLGKGSTFHLMLPTELMYAEKKQKQEEFKLEVA